jgi:hypothetical protein
MPSIIIIIAILLVGVAAQALPSRLQATGVCAVQFSVLCVTFPFSCFVALQLDRMAHICRANKQNRLPFSASASVFQSYLMRPLFYSDISAIQLWLWIKQHRMHLCTWYSTPAITLYLIYEVASAGWLGFHHSWLSTN